MILRSISGLLSHDLTIDLGTAEVAISHSGVFFPKIAGEIDLGITAVSSVGHE